MSIDRHLSHAVNSSGQHESLKLNSTGELRTDSITDTIRSTQILTNTAIAGGANIEKNYKRKSNGSVCFAIRTDAFKTTSVVLYASYDNIVYNALHSGTYVVNSYNSNLRVVVLKEGVLSPYLRIKVNNTTGDSDNFNIWVNE